MSDPTLSPDGRARLVEGTLLEVVPKHGFVFEGRLVMDPLLAGDAPHLETFEIEDVGGARVDRSLAGDCRATRAVAARGRHPAPQRAT
jgi:hypothetical protein